MNENNGIVWEEPPNRGRLYTDWNVVLEPLRKRPGQWARVKVCKTQGSAASSRHRIQTARKVPDCHLFEVTTNKLEDGTYGIYARYVPERVA